MSWHALPITRVVRIVGGGTPSKANTNFWNGDIPWVSPKDMTSAEIADTEDHITQAALEQSATQVVPPSSVLMVVRSGILAHKLPVALTQNAAALNQDMKALICEPSLQPRFLAYFLQFKEREILSNFVKRGATVHSIEMSRFNKIHVPLPALLEQNRIVEILDQADALRKRARETDAKAARILPALFLKMFGDPATNSMGWPMTTVGELLISADYGTSTRASDDGRGSPLIRMGNVAVDGSLQLDNLKYVKLPDREVEKYALANGDILFNRTNSLDLVGKTGLWRGEMEAVLASYFIRLRVDRKKVAPLFLWAYMNTAHMKRVLRATARGAIGQANINTRELRAFAIYRPPPAAQKRFAELVGRVNAAVPTSQLRSRLDALFDGLLQRAFSGQLTAKWREAHMQDLLAEMEEQASLLNLPAPN